MKIDIWFKTTIQKTEKNKAYLFKKKGNGVNRFL